MRPPVTCPARICPVRLADDGIVDPVAVDIAARGVRPVGLTETERRAAVALLLSRGGSPSLAAYRMRISLSTVRAIAAWLAEASYPEIWAHSASGNVRTIAREVA